MFTLPAALREFVRAHQRVCLAALMATAAESLRALAADPHYVGGTVGILAVLHTWTRPRSATPPVNQRGPPCRQPRGRVRGVRAVFSGCTVASHRLAGSV